MAGGTIKGSGTELTPYLIEDSEDIFNINSVDTTDAYIELTQDIDMGGITLQNSYLISFDQAPFSLDGRGHSISNYSIIFDTLNSPAGTVNDLERPRNILNLGLNIDSLVSNFDQVGVMFGYLLASDDDIIIKNCYTTSNNISGSDRVGGFAGNIDSGSLSFLNIENCYSVSNNISGSERVGGFAGNIARTPIIKSYSYSNSISGSDRVGGFVGTPDRSEIHRSFAFTHKIIRTPSSSGSGFGAFAGRVFSTSFDYCYSNSDIEFLEE